MKKMTGNHIRGYLYSREIVKVRASKFSKFKVVLFPLIKYIKNHLTII